MSRLKQATAEALQKKSEALHPWLGSPGLVLLHDTFVHY